MWNVASEDLLLNDDYADDDDGRFGWDHKGQIFGISAEEVTESRSKNTRSIHCLRIRIADVGQKSTNALLRNKMLPSPLGVMIRISSEISHPSKVSIYCYAEDSAAESGAVVLQHSRYDLLPSDVDADLGDVHYTSPAAITIKCLNLKVGHLLEVKLTSCIDSQLIVTHTSVVDIDVPIDLAQSYGSRPKFLELKQFNNEKWASMQVDALVRYLHSLGRIVRDINGIAIAAEFMESCQFKACESCQNNSTIHLLDEYIEEDTIPPVVFCTSMNCGGAWIADDFYRSTLEGENFKAAIKFRFDQYVSSYFNWERWRQRNSMFASSQRRREYAEAVRLYDELYQDKLVCPKCHQFEPYDSYYYRVVTNEALTDPALKFRSTCAKCKALYAQRVSWDADRWHAKTATFVQTKASKVEKLRDLVAVAQAKRDSYIPTPMFKDTLGAVTMQNLEGVLIQELTERGVKRVLNPAKYYRALKHSLRKHRAMKQAQRAATGSVREGSGPIPGPEDAGAEPTLPIPQSGETTDCVSSFRPNAKIGTGFGSAGRGTEGMALDGFFMTDSFNSDALVEDDPSPLLPLDEDGLVVEVAVDAPQPLAPLEVPVTFSGLRVGLDDDDTSRLSPLVQQYTHVLEEHQSVHSVYSTHVVQKKQSALQWTSGIAGLNPTPVREDSPLFAKVALKRCTLLRVPCLHSSRHEILKPWEPAELVVLKPKAKLGDRPPPPSGDMVLPGPHHATHHLPGEIANFVSIRYFYTMYDEQQHELRPPIALPSIVANTYSTFHFSKCEYPTVMDADFADLALQWVEPQVCGGRRTLPLGAMFSVALVPAMDVDLDSVHYVAQPGSTADLPISSDFVYELVFPVQAIDHYTEEVVFGFFRVCMDKPVPYFDEFDDVNDIIYVHSKHHKVFIDQLLQKMKRTCGDFLVTSELASLIGPIDRDSVATFTIRGEVSLFDLCEVEFLCEGNVAW